MLKLLLMFSSLVELWVERVSTWYFPERVNFLRVALIFASSVMTGSPVGLKRANIKQKP